MCLAQFLRVRLTHPALFIKRDDCAGLDTGGNKTRQLGFLTADSVNSHVNVARITMKFAHFIFAYFAESKNKP